MKKILFIISVISVIAVMSVVFANDFGMAKKQNVYLANDEETSEYEMPTEIPEDAYDDMEPEESGDIGDLPESEELFYEDGEASFDASLNSGEEEMINSEVEEGPDEIIVEVEEDTFFKDVSENFWAYSYIKELTSIKVIDGYPDGNFLPNGTITRGEFLKLLSVSSLNVINYDFFEADFDHWAAKYVKVLEKYDVLRQGEITLENIDKPITRIEMARFLGKADINAKKTAQGIVDVVLTDINDIDAADKALLTHCVAKGYINGYEDDSFRPSNTLTRAEAAKVIYTYEYAR